MRHPSYSAWMVWSVSTQILLVSHHTSFTFLSFAKLASGFCFCYLLLPSDAMRLFSQCNPICPVLYASGLPPPPPLPPLLHPSTPASAALS
jgi:hypothetical protein